MIRCGVNEGVTVLARQGDVTAGDVIHRRLTGEEILGETAPGDYREGCRTCH